MQITLSRAMAALNMWQKIKLAWHLLTNKEAIRCVLLSCVQADHLRDTWHLGEGRGREEEGGSMFMCACVCEKFN